MVIGERIKHSGVRCGFDGREEAVDAVGMGYVIGILADKPGRAALGEHSIESGSEAPVRLNEDANARGDGEICSKRAKIFEAGVGGSVNNSEDFKPLALLRKEAFDRLGQKWHGVIDGQADGQERLRTHSVRDCGFVMAMRQRL